MNVRRMALAACCALAVAARAIAAPPTPASFVGHRIGEDRKLVRWPVILAYFDALARDSDRVKIAELGKTSGGNRMIAAVISSADNLAKADDYRDIAQRLASPRGMSEAQAQELAAKGRAIIAVTMNLHSTEIASSQMALELGYQLASDESVATRALLDGAIVLLIPSLNPDGQIMVCDWYQQTLGTPFEGGRLPWLYHQYAGHDNNRDWFMLNLVETRLVTKFLYQDWHPQAIHDQHQMGSQGARIFVPPYYDPVNPNVHPLIWREIAAAGAQMTLRLEEKGRTGIVSSALYDGWRPGDMDTTPWWHNTVGLLTEAASVKIATPIQQKREELTLVRGPQPDYGSRMSFPNPWPGGWWRLRDIVDYELDAAMAFIETSARRKTDLLMNSYRMNRDAIDRGSRQSPYAFVVNAGNNDAWTVARMLDPLIAAGVEVQRATAAFTADGVQYPAGSHVILMAQPLRPYAKDLLEAQHYPDRRLFPGGPPEPPYDEAGWTLPFKMGVQVTAVAGKFDADLDRVKTAEVARGRVDGGTGAAAVAFAPSSSAASLAVNRLLKAGHTVTWSDGPVDASGTSLPANSFAVAVGARGLDPIRSILEPLGITAHAVAATVRGTSLRAPRVGIYQPWGGNPDEGWTRWVFDQFELPYRTLHAEDIRAGGLTGALDAVILPSMSAVEIRTGETSANQAAPTLPARYAGGLGPEGVIQLASFVRDGGTLVALDGASAFAIETFELPVRNALDGLKSDQFFCPGSILQVSVRRGHHLTAGLAENADIYFMRSPAFELAPSFEADAPVALAAYGSGQLLRSGWVLGEKYLTGRAALVEARYGKGRIVLVGFRAQFRGQTYGTFKVLFNAVFDAALHREALLPAAGTARRAATRGGTGGDRTLR